MDGSFITILSGFSAGPGCDLDLGLALAPFVELFLGTDLASAGPLSTIHSQETLCSASALDTFSQETLAFDSSAALSVSLDFFVPDRVYDFFYDLSLSTTSSSALDFFVPDRVYDFFYPDVVDFFTSFPSSYVTDHLSSPPFSSLLQSTQDALFVPLFLATVPFFVIDFFAAGFSLFSDVYSLFSLLSSFSFSSSRASTFLAPFVLVRLASSFLLSLSFFSPSIPWC